MASIGDRIKAHVVDMLLFWSLGGIGAWLMWISTHRETATTLVAIACAVVVIVGQAYLLARYDQSLGKKIFHIKIVSASTGESAGFVSNFWIRACVGQLLRSFIPGFIFVDYGFVFGKTSQCLHDRMAGTLVIPESPGSVPLERLTVPTAQGARLDWTRQSSKLLIAAFVIQAGSLLWTIGGIRSITQAIALMPVLLPVGCGLAWLLQKPGTAPITYLIVLHVIFGSVELYVFQRMGSTIPYRFLMLAPLIHRVVAVALMASAIPMLRRERNPIPESDHQLTL